MSSGELASSVPEDKLEAIKADRARRAAKEEEEKKKEEREMEIDCATIWSPSCPSLLRDEMEIDSVALARALAHAELPLPPHTCLSRGIV